MLIYERLLRDKSYSGNLQKEARITQMFIEWCRKNHIRYRINPTDSQLNCDGSDVSVNINGEHWEVDIKGTSAAFDTCCLSYERSYDGVHYWDCLFNSKKNTTLYIFIEEDGDIYGITRDEILFRFPDYKKTTAKPDKAGHWQKCILIPKSELRML